MKIFNKLKSAPSYLLRNYALPRILTYKNRSLLSKNIKLKGKYQNKKCFIVGNGPSIGKLNLGELKNEYTFVVNEFDKNPQFGPLNPKFYILSDSCYYNENAQSIDYSSYFLDQFKTKEEVIPRSTILFTNIDAKDSIEKYNLFDGRKLYYIGTQGIITDLLPFNVELDKYIPRTKNSALLCLIIAVYLGFREIYLLGCEHNFLSHPTVPLAFDRSYEDELSDIDTAKNQVVGKYITPKLSKMSYEHAVANILQLFRNYRFFYQKIRKIYPDIKIYNATPNSFLDVFPTVKFEDIKFDD